MSDILCGLAIKVPWLRTHSFRVIHTGVVSALVTMHYAVFQIFSQLFTTAKDDAVIFFIKGIIQFEREQLKLH